MPLLGQKAYVSYRECKIYADTAHANTNSFITNHVLPQLRRLTSDVTGLDGFVLPPPCITKTVPRAAQQPITSAKREFVFIHGDLARHNIIISPETLEVTCIFDQEHIGYFPLKLEVDAWRIKHSKYFRLFTYQERIQRELELIGGKGRLPPCIKEGFILRLEQSLIQLNCRQNVNLLYLN